MEYNGIGSGNTATVRAKYPHMMPLDAKVWTDYLLTVEHKLFEVWYDVHVGTPMKSAEDPDGMLHRVAMGVSRKRIDVVGYFGWCLGIIEVKPICNMESIGQAYTYRKLFQKEFDYKGNIIPMVVCRQIEIDVVPAARDMGVAYRALEGILE